MKSRSLICCVLLGWATCASAAPIIFSSQQYETSAVATAGSQATTDFDTSPPSPLPLISEATVFNATSFASGSGIAAPNLLTTSADVSVSSGVSSGVGTAQFTGSFVAGGPMLIRMAFDTQDSTDLNAFSGGTLFLLFISNNVTLLSELFAVDSIATRGFTLPAGSLNTVQLLLSSEASTLTGGNAFNFASLSFEFALPTPPTWSLLLPGLLVLGFRSVRNRAKTH